VRSTSIRNLDQPYVARPLQFDVDATALAARLAEIAADETWPEALRAQAHIGGVGLEVSELTEDAIVAARRLDGQQNEVLVSSEPADRV